MKFKLLFLFLCAALASKAQSETDSVRQIIAAHNNTHLSRYFVCGTGYGLPKGSGYVQNNLLFFNQGSFGINDYLSFGAAVFIAPPILPENKYVMLGLSPKISIPLWKERIQWSIGATFGSIPFSYFNPIGLTYSGLTFGPRRQNISFGAAWGYYGEWADHFTMTFHYVYQINQRFSLYAEGYWPARRSNWETYSFITGRYRHKKITFDAGVVYFSFDRTPSFIFPLLGVGLPFYIGKNKPGKM